MLCNNKIIKCVQEYYTVPGKKKIQHSGISKCYKKYSRKSASWKRWA